MEGFYHYAVERLQGEINELQDMVITLGQVAYELAGKVREDGQETEGSGTEDSGQEEDKRILCKSYTKIEEEKHNRSEEQGRGKGKRKAGGEQGKGKGKEKGKGKK